MQGGYIGELSVVIKGRSTCVPGSPLWNVSTRSSCEGECTDDGIICLCAVQAPEGRW